MGGKKKNVDKLTKDLKDILRKIYTQMPGTYEEKREAIIQQVGISIESVEKARQEKQEQRQRKTDEYRRKRQERSKKLRNQEDKLARFKQRAAEIPDDTETLMKEFNYKNRSLVNTYMSNYGIYGETKILQAIKEKAELGISEEEANIQIAQEGNVTIQAVVRIRNQAEEKEKTISLKQTERKETIKQRKQERENRIARFKQRAAEIPDDTETLMKEFNYKNRSLVNTYMSNYGIYGETKILQAIKEKAELGISEEEANIQIAEEGNVTVEAVIRIRKRLSKENRLDHKSTKTIQFIERASQIPDDTETLMNEFGYKNIQNVMCLMNRHGIYSTKKIARAIQEKSENSNLTEDEINAQIAQEGKVTIEAVARIRKRLPKAQANKKTVDEQQSITIVQKPEQPEKIVKAPKGTNSRTYSYNEMASIRNEEAHAKMQQMRERYRNLYFKSNKKTTVDRKELSEEEIEAINSCITTIENIIKEMKDTSKSTERKHVNYIIAEIKKIQDYQLTVEQAEKLNILLNSEELRKLKPGLIYEVSIYINRYRRIIARKLVEAVDIAQSQTEDLGELEKLGRKITSEMERENPVLAGGVRSKINNKISVIQQKKAVERIKNDIPKSILGIINDLANGTVDIEKANEIIKEEAKKKVDSKPKTRFSLTEQQEERQILIQIGIAIRERADRFHITDPETTICQIQQLCGQDLGQAVRTVVENLISAKNFEEAKRVCDKFAGKDRESKIAAEMRNLKLRIRNAEISDIALKGIYMKGTAEEERKYFELLEKGIKMGNVSLKSISLGKSQDGARDITLADIWTDENQKEKTK